MICKSQSKTRSKIRVKDIKEKRVYYVDYEPSVGNEFGKHHLSLVLKKNREDKTLIVVPLTGKKDNRTPEKTIKIKVEGLPERLKHKESYAVINKVRTLDYSMFEHILDVKIIEVEVSDVEFTNLISHITDELEESLDLETKKKMYAEKIDRAINKEIKNLVYEYKRLKENRDGIVTKIMDIIYNNNKDFLELNKYHFTNNDKENNLENITLEILEKIKSLNL